MSGELRHEWTDEQDGRTFSVCESDNLTPCQREILNLRRQRDGVEARLAQALSESRELWHGADEAPAVREVTFRVAEALGFAAERFLAAAGYEIRRESETDHA